MLRTFGPFKLQRYKFSAIFYTLADKSRKMKRIILIAALTMLFSCNSKKPQYDIETFPTQTGALSVHCIRHGSLAIDFKDYRILIDPVGEMDGQTIDYSAFGKADAVFVTHEHFDHMDPQLIGKLSKEGTRVFANAAGCGKMGFGEAVAAGCSGILNDRISYTVVPAYNVTPDHLKFHPKGNGNGYVFDIDGIRIYVAGDTEFIPEMKEMEGIDVAFLPCNQPYTMTVDMAVEAAEAISPKIFVPYHLTDTNVDAIRKALDGSGIEVRLHESLR